MFFQAINAGLKKVFESIVLLRVKNWNFKVKIPYENSKSTSLLHKIWFGSLHLFIIIGKSFYGTIRISYYNYNRLEFGLLTAKNGSSLVMKLMWRWKRMNDPERGGRGRGNYRESVECIWKKTHAFRHINRESLVSSVISNQLLNEHSWNWLWIWCALLRWSIVFWIFREIF